MAPSCSARSSTRRRSRRTPAPGMAALRARSPSAARRARAAPSEPAHGVRGALVHATDPLRLEWTVAVVSPHFAAALTAYDLGEEAPEDRRYEFVLTYDRELAVGAAASLMARVPR